MLVVVVMPVLRSGGSPALVRELASAAGRRFAAVTNWVLLPVLVVSGIALAALNGVRLDNLTTTAFGRVLLVKAALVGGVFALASVHGLVAHRLPRNRTRLLAAVTLFGSIAILGLGATLAVIPGP
jgi:putative copper export protein